MKKIGVLNCLSYMSGSQGLTKHLERNLFVILSLYILNKNFINNSKVPITLYVKRQ